jgi:hypothetical protein
MVAGASVNRQNSQGDSTSWEYILSSPTAAAAGEANQHKHSAGHAMRTLLLSPSLLPKRVLFRTPECAIITSATRLDAGGPKSACASSCLPWHADAPHARRCRARRASLRHAIRLYSLRRLCRRSILNPSSQARHNANSARCRSAKLGGGSANQETSDCDRRRRRVDTGRYKGAHEVDGI